MYPTGGDPLSQAGPSAGGLEPDHDGGADHAASNLRSPAAGQPRAAPRLCT